MATEVEKVDRYINDTSHYHDCLAKIDKHLKDNDSGNTKRFVQMEDRKKESVYTMDNIKNISCGKYKTSWCGVNMMKGPLDMVILQELIWREKPNTIIEIGAYSGASAMWMADIAKLNSISCHVYALDIDISLVDPRALAHPEVTFIRGDATKVEESFPAELLKNLPHPWVISEDAHVDLVGCMEYFHKFMVPGDYFVIEDTNPEMPSTSGQCLHEELGYVPWGLQKHSLLEMFMKDHKEIYAVDTFYADFFGYNGTCNWNGFLRRMK